MVITKCKGAGGGALLTVENFAFMAFLESQNEIFEDRRPDITSMKDFPEQWHIQTYDHHMHQTGNHLTPAQPLQG